MCQCWRSSDDWRGFPLRWVEMDKILKFAAPGPPPGRQTGRSEQRENRSEQREPNLNKDLNNGIVVQIVVQLGKPVVQIQKPLFRSLFRRKSRCSAKKRRNLNIDHSKSQKNLNIAAPDLNTGTTIWTRSEQRENGSEQRGTRSEQRGNRSEQRGNRSEQREPNGIYFVFLLFSLIPEKL